MKAKAHNTSAHEQQFCPRKWKKTSFTEQPQTALLEYLTVYGALTTTKVFYISYTSTTGLARGQTAFDLSSLPGLAEGGDMWPR